MIGQFGEWLKNKRTHLISWSIFMAYEIIVIGLSSGIFGHPITYAAHYALSIMLFYVHALKALPWAKTQARFSVWRLFFIVSVEIVVSLIASHLVNIWLYKTGIAHKGPVIITVPYVMRELYRCLYFIGFGTGYYYIRTYINEKKRSAELEKQRLQEIINRRVAEEEAIRSQNAFLVAQINPHFLFNTLDYLYHSLLPLDNKLADAVISLSGMMRFAIDADKMGHTISLADELEQVESLIYLHQMRQKLFVDLLVDERMHELRIIPLVLLTLTENVFKHGKLNDAASPARIAVYADKTHLHIETANIINRLATAARSLTGLANIHKRLNVAYPQRFTFTYGADDSNIFNVKISIELAALKQTGDVSYQVAGIDKH